MLSRSLNFIVCLLCAGSVWATTEVVNRDQLRGSLAVSGYPSGANLANVKVAILDNGFGEFQPHTGLLPDSAQLIEGPVDALSATDHGLGMAQIVWALTGQNPSGPQFYLINSNGFSNLKAGIDFVIANHVDIVLYSQVWPFGSNFDGTGFINDNVNRAINAGVIWINAAGNDHNMVFNSPIAANEDSTTHLLKFNGQDRLHFTNKLDQNQVDVTLSWNDFRSEDYNTNKCLFLYIYDSSDKLVASSTLIQQGEAPPAIGNSNLSSYARQSVTLPSLDRGEFYIRIKDQSKNFTSTDRLRVLISVNKTGSVDFVDHTNDGEIMAPADNPNVLTVGEAGNISSVGPTFDNRIKPDVLVKDATVSFSNGTEARGSSNAAALVAGTAAILKANNPAYSFKDLWARVAQLKSVIVPYPDLSGVQPGSITPAVQAIVPIGCNLMRKVTPGIRFVVTCTLDPLSFPMFAGAAAVKQHPEDILTLNPNDHKWTLFYKAQDSQISPIFVEFRQIQANSMPLFTAPVLGQR